MGGCGGGNLRDHTSKKGKIESIPLHSVMEFMIQLLKKYRKNEFKSS